MAAEQVSSYVSLWIFSAVISSVLCSWSVGGAHSCSCTQPPLTSSAAVGLLRCWFVADVSVVSESCRKRARILGLEVKDIRETFEQDIPWWQPLHQHHRNNSCPCCFSVKHSINIQSNSRMMSLTSREPLFSNSDSTLASKVRDATRKKKSLTPSPGSVVRKFQIMVWLVLSFKGKVHQTSRSTPTWLGWHGPVFSFDLLRQPDGFLFHLGQLLWSL